MGEFIKIITKYRKWILLLIAFSIVIFYVLSPKKKELVTDNPIDTDTVFLEALKQLQVDFLEGNGAEYYAKGEYSCPELIPDGLNVDDSYFQCNELHLNCLLKGATPKKKSTYSVTFEGNEYEVEFVKLDTDQTPYTEFIKKQKQKHINNSLFKVKMNFNNESRIGFIENSCKHKFLEHSYFYSGNKSRLSLKWDNFSRYFYFDIHYVSNYEVSRWNKKKIKVSDYHKPSVDLSFQEMKNFCHDHGKELILSEVLDAASMIRNNHNVNYFYYYPYPWGKQKRNVFETNTDEVIKKAKTWCQKAYVAGCEKYTPLKLYNSSSSTWSGLYLALGYEMEAVENKNNQFLNISPSSYYFNGNSKWNTLGSRAHWNGIGHELSAFHFSRNINIIARQENLPNNKNGLGVAFRCMKREFPHE